jgi:glycosyltransferase involved in cell wall biosynthesis
MKVLHVINNLNKGGAERLLVDILPLYRDTEADVSVLQLSSKASSLEYLNLLTSRQVKVFSLGNGSLYNPLLILKLRSFIRKNKFDIVHAHLFPTMYWISLAFRLLGRNRPVLIFTEHSTQNNRINNPVLRPVDRFIYKKYDSVIAISEAIAAKLKAWMGNAPPVALIRNGVNTDHFSKASAYDAAFFSREFSIPEPAVKILMTARFLYPKDHLTVVKAIKLLPLNFHVIFAGEGAERAGVEQWVNDNGLNERVHFAGFRTDIPALMKSVDLNVLSSRYEGMSGVTLEALAAGKPFLGSDVPGINDVVPDNRFVFESGNENHLAAQAEHVLNNEKVKQQMVSEGLKFAQLFDVSIMIAQHIALYKQQILDKKRS